MAPFRERFELLESQGRISRSELARTLGWYRNPAPSQRRITCKVVDTGRASRLLRQQIVGYEMGVQLCPILGLDPVDAGV